MYWIIAVATGLVFHYIVCRFPSTAPSENKALVVLYDDVVRASSAAAGLLFASILDPGSRLLCAAVISAAISTVFLEMLYVYRLKKYRFSQTTNSRAVNRGGSRMITVSSR